jgi:hypothetical protein
MESGYFKLNPRQPKLIAITYFNSLKLFFGLRNVSYYIYTRTRLNTTHFIGTSGGSITVT